MSLETFMAYEWKSIGISIGIFLLFLLFRKIFSTYIFKLILKITKKTPTDFFTHVFLAFEKPLRWLFVIIGIYVAVTYFPYIKQTNPTFIAFFKSSIVILITWGLYNLSSSTSVLFEKLNKRLNIEIDQILIPFLSKAIRFVIIAISLSVIAQQFGFDVNGFVAGLGLGGLAFALAAKDAIGNLFGGIIIITEKPFSIGDWIMTPSVEGTVEDISFRSTKIRTFAQALVTVPNATLANESITNWSRMGKRRINFELGVTYETPKATLKKVIKRLEKMLKEHPEIHQETIFVKFDEYKQNSLAIFFYFFTKTTVWEEYLNVKQDVNFKIMDILEEEGVSVAFPTRTLHVVGNNEREKEVTGG